MASSISSGSGQASPARRARCRQSMTVVAPIDRLAAILRLDMPAAVSRSTSRMLRMGNLAPDIGPFPPVEKGPTSLGFADHPTAPFTLLPRNSQPLLGIARNGCSGSVGTTARDQSVRVLEINWNSCSGSLGAPKQIGLHANHRTLSGAFPSHGSPMCATSTILALCAGDLTPSVGKMTFLLAGQGRPFTANGVGGWFRDRCNE